MTGEMLDLDVCDLEAMHCYNSWEFPSHQFITDFDQIQESAWHMPLHFGDAPLIPNSERHHRLAKRIQRSWRTAVANPNYLLCRRRLMREFEDNPVILSVE